MRTVVRIARRLPHYLTSRTTMPNALSQSSVPTIRDHAHAAQIYETLKDFPPRHYGTHRDAGEKLGRPLSGPARNLGHMSLRLHQGAWKARYHNTDCVIYHENGDVTLNPWQSQSTNAFVNGLLPGGAICADYAEKHGNLVWCQSRPGTYNTGGETWSGRVEPDNFIPTVWSGDFRGYLIPSRRGMRFVRGDDGYFEPAEECETFDIPRIGEGMAKVCREHRLTDFVAWSAAMKSGAFGTVASRRYDKQLNVADALKDQAQWMGLLERHAFEGVLEENKYLGWQRSRVRRGQWCAHKFRAHMRRELAAATGMYEVETCDRFEDHKHYARWKAAERVHGRYA